MSGNFFDQPNPWWHDVIMIPIYLAGVMCFDEFVMRRNPHIGIFFAFATLFTIPFQYAYGGLGEGSAALFLLMKTYSINAMAILLTLIRLAYIMHYEETQIDPDSPKITFDRNNSSIRQSKVQTFFPLTWIKFLHKYFDNNRAEIIIGRLSYALLWLNMLEAIGFEAVFGRFEDNDQRWTWTRWFNVAAGGIVLLTAPPPDLKYYYVKKRDFYDWVMFLPNTKAHWYYCGVGWIILYVIWDSIYIYDFIGYVGFNTNFVHNGGPFIVALINHRYGLWFQSRVYILWSYLCIFYLFRIFVFKGTGNNHWEGPGNAYFLAAGSVFNFCFGLAYTYIWFCKYLPFRKTHTLRVSKVDDLGDIAGDETARNTEMNKRAISTDSENASV